MTRSGYFLDLVVFFEFGGAAVAEGAVQPGAVVPADVVNDRPARRGPGGPGLGIDQLAFDRGEETLGQGVVPALAGAPHRQGHLAVAGQLSEAGRGVLAASIAVEDHPWAGAAGGDGIG